MKFTEAFNALGYDLEVPRQDWSAESGNGICITIWRKEMGRKDGLPWFDSKLHGGPLEEWHSKPGNSKRKRHLLKISINSVIDVVIVEGTPGDGYDDAHCRRPSERHGASWRLTSSEPETGHFSVEVRRSET